MLAQIVLKLVFLFIFNSALPFNLSLQIAISLRILVTSSEQKIPCIENTITYRFPIDSGNVEIAEQNVSSRSFAFGRIECYSSLDTQAVNTTGVRPLTGISTWINIDDAQC